MFEGWGNFYFLLGSASASLIGLMFVVTTLTRGADRARAERGQRLFMTPTVFDFAAVLTLSALSLAPRLGPDRHRLLLAAVAGYGLGYACVIAWQLLRGGRSAVAHWSDTWCYGLIPVIAYLAYEVSILATMANHDLACDAAAISLLAILLVAARNAWDLVTWMAPMANAPPPPSA